MLRTAGGKGDTSQDRLGTGENRVGGSCRWPDKNRASTGAKKSATSDQSKSGIVVGAIEGYIDHR